LPLSAADEFLAVVFDSGWMSFELLNKPRAVFPVARGGFQVSALAYEVAIYGFHQYLPDVFTCH